MASQDRAAGAAASLRPEEEWPKTVKLTSGDGEVFEVEVAAARRSVLVLHMMELDVAWDKGGITLPTLSGDILTLVVEYLKAAHLDDSDGDDKTKTTALKNFDDNVIKQLDQATLINLISAANFLNIKGLLYLTIPTVAGMIKGKTYVELRKTFNIVSDFSPEEEEELRREELRRELRREELRRERQWVDNTFFL